MQPPRDHLTEMVEVIDAAAKPPYVPRTLAAKIVQRLRAEDPKLLEGWLDASAEHFVWQAINDRDRSRRSYSSAHASATAFGRAAEAAEAGDSAQLRTFLDSRYTIADGTRRPLGKLKHADLSFVADRYQQRERRNAFRKVFFQTLAKKVTVGTVEDHYTEEQLATMWASLPI